MKWDWKLWARAAGIRALKTFAQVMVAGLTLGEPTTGILEIDWLAIASMALLASLVSVLTSVTGLPEVPESGQTTTNYPGKV